MNTDDLWDYITELFDLLGDHNVDISDFEDRWNFITDIDTNGIRPEGLQAARELADEMESTYQNLR